MSYKKINKQINDYLQAVTSDQSVFNNVERRRIRIANKLLTPKNESLLEVEYKKAKEEALAFKGLVTGESNPYSINDQLMDVIKYIGDTLNNKIKELGVNGSQLQIEKLNMQSRQQIEQLRNDVSVFINAIQQFDAVKETPIGAANSIIPESNPAFINYVENRENKDILLVPLPDMSGFNLVILEKNGKINKESGVIPLSEFTKAMQAGEIGGYFEQVPTAEVLQVFYSDLDNFVASLIQTDVQLVQQTGEGLFKRTKKKETKVPRKGMEETMMETPQEYTDKQIRDFFRRTPKGQQMMYAFLDDESSLGYYKNLQYTEYMDKNKMFSTDNYLKAIENYLVSKFNIPAPQEQPEEVVEEEVVVSPENQSV